MNLFCISCIETDQNKKNDKKIDNKLKKWHYKETKAIRLLLLGTISILINFNFFFNLPIPFIFDSFQVPVKAERPHL